MPSGTPQPELRLARLVGLRLCHDLSGVVGTIGNALEMMAGVGEEAAALAVESAGVLRQRLLLWRAVLGGQGEATLGTLLALLEGQLAGGRASADAAALDPGTMVAEPMVPVILSAMLVAGEALPRGGVVRLAGDPAGEMAVLPDGPRAAWPAPLIRAVAGAEPLEEPTGRDVMALWLAATAAAGGMRLGLALPPGAGAGPLLITAAR
jgi:histidine phosphotransferase ChpT